MVVLSPTKTYYFIMIYILKGLHSLIIILSISLIYLILSFFIFLFFYLASLMSVYIFSLINDYFLKNKNDIYWFVFFFLFFSFLWLLGLTHYYIVCVLSGVLSSSYYFCLLFFLHLILTLFFCSFLGWRINNLVRLHSKHIGWIRVSEVVVYLSSSC